jgi:MraZ protein
MLLTGSFHRSLDEKSRFAIPRKLRDALVHPTHSTVLYLTPGTDASLALYSEEAFSRLAEKLAQGSPADLDNRTFGRLFYAQAQCVELDRLGRIRIPPDLIALGRLSKEIVLLGVRDHLEIWDKPRWDEYLTQKQPRYDEIAENAFLPLGSAAPIATRPADTQPDSSVYERPLQPR